MKPSWRENFQTGTRCCNSQPSKRIGHQPHHPRTIADGLRCFALGFVQPAKRVRSLAPHCEQVREASTQRFGLFGRRFWQNALALVAGDARRSKHFPSSNLRQVLSRFVAYVGSSSGVEQTFSQCLSQFRHLRQYSDLGMQWILVLAGARWQSETPTTSCTHEHGWYEQNTSPHLDVEKQ